ncbi:hypothetical protein BDW59DRAFT_160865 [Aspergillus cavernicola]|uniref:Uncharacterized protein n=1 Tax=Aspergillus cavernicola TaxID=176166 RepID=A0ABR4IG28_9EURO
MEVVNQEVLNAIEGHDSIRIIADVPTDRLNSGSDPLAAATELMTPFITQWAVKHHTRLLVLDLYPRHGYIVTDINNHRYDFDTAHTQLFAIPIYILRLSRKGKWSFWRRPVSDIQIAKQIADLHRCNGWIPTPYFTDHINGPVYMSARTPPDLSVGTAIRRNASTPLSSVLRSAREADVAPDAPVEPAQSSNSDGMNMQHGCSLQETNLSRH